MLIFFTELCDIQSILSTLSMQQHTKGQHDTEHYNGFQYTMELKEKKKKQHILFFGIIWNKAAL